MTFGAGYFQANWNVAPNESYLSFKELFMSSHENQSAVEANETNPAGSTIDTQEKKPSKFQGQTGPKTQAGKFRSKWNALTHGRTAKSPLLPFEDPQQYKTHISEIHKALVPDNYVEHQIVEEYANSTWRLQRQEKRSAYQRERILETLTPTMIAGMLGLEERYCKAAPDYFINPKHKISQAQQILALSALDEYHRLLQNAKGIANFNLVWRQFPDLFNALAKWVEMQDATRPLFSSSGKDLDLAWQQNPQEILKSLDKLELILYFIANFMEFKPQLRTLMESWYFAQRLELQHLERDDGGLIAERKHANALLDKLMQLRKSQFLLWAAIPKEPSLHGFHPPKEIGFQRE
jgi:hypothetical protein